MVFSETREVTPGSEQQGEVARAGDTFLWEGKSHAEERDPSQEGGSLKVL